MIASFLFVPTVRRVSQQYLRIHNIQVTTYITTAIQSYPGTPRMATPTSGDARERRRGAEAVAGDSIATPGRGTGSRRCLFAGETIVAVLIVIREDNDGDGPLFLLRDRFEAIVVLVFLRSECVPALTST
jgi:hypothetical protein